jgi:hypothetical protein
VHFPATIASGATFKDAPDAHPDAELGMITSFDVP